MSLNQVAAALQDANVTLPAGDFSDGTGEYVVRVDEHFRTRDQVVATVVRSDADGSFVTLDDLISDATLGYPTPSVITSADGKDGVALRLLKAEGGSAMEIYAATEAILEEVAPLLEQEGIEVVLTQDSTTYIEESIQTLG